MKIGLQPHLKEALLDLTDPRRDSAFRLQNLSVADTSYEPQRTNYFSIYWIEGGEGEFFADATACRFGPDQLLFFVPYRYIRFQPRHEFQATLLQFHANFLCIETFHSETGCSGVLFGDPYHPPIVQLDKSSKSDLLELLQRIRREIAQRSLGYMEAVLACMKLFLIIATRLKSGVGSNTVRNLGDFRNPVLESLRELIERHYLTLHSPSEYARLLHLTPKTLGRSVRKHLGKTLTDLIRERILTHVKWDLLHTLKSVKQIAAETGFRDELYFSRFFKKATGVSPTFFREFETEIRGGRNLSMNLAQVPIQATDVEEDTSESSGNSHLKPES